MSNATPSRLGQIQSAGNDRALFLDIFGGEVLTAFETAVNLKDKHMQRAIEHGRSARFPAIFKAGTRYHTPGTEILGSPIQHNEVTITIDDVLISDVTIAQIDELMNHYDVRAPYATELGNALALAFDRNVCRNLLLAARDTTPLFAGDGAGAQLTNAAFNNSATALFDGISQAKQALEEKDVPVDRIPVYGAFKPAQWYLMSRSSLNINRDTGGNGSSNARSTITTVDDVIVIKSNAYPYGLNESAAAELPAKYRGNWTNTRGVVWTDMAAATLSLMNVQLEAEWDIRRQVTLMVAKYLVGHGKLRSKCAVELRTAA